MIYAAAFISAILASMGVGGGMILIIWLTAFAGYSQLEAQGINLLCFIPTAILAVIIHAKNGLIEFRRLLPAILTGALFAVLGSMAAKWIGSDILGKMFGGFILAAGLKELFTKNKNAS